MPASLRLPSAFATMFLVGCWSLNQRADETPAAPSPSGPVLGSGSLHFEWQQDWARLPEGMGFGNTHGCIVVDKHDRVYVNTDSAHAVLVFESDGTLVDAWGTELAGGVHGMSLEEEDGVEYLLLVHTLRQEVLRTTLDGKVVWRLGRPDASGHYAKPAQYRPTAVARGPDGSLYVADGYGRSFVHVFDAERNYQRTFGGVGTQPGSFRTPHGLRLEAGDGTPTLLVADRENHRLQRLALDGSVLAVFDQGLRRPCNTAAFGELLAVADLAGRVTLLDQAGAVLAQLGDNPDEAQRANNGVPSADWRAGRFLAPHGLAFDSRGDLYVQDWVRAGRVTKLRRLDR